MRKLTLTVLGFAGLSLLLCGTGEVLAQANTTADPRDTDAADTRVQGTPPGDVRVGGTGTDTPGARTSGATGTGGAGAEGTTGTAGTGGTGAAGTTGTGGVGAPGTTDTTGGAGAAGTAGTGVSPGAQTSGTTGAGGAGTSVPGTGQAAGGAGASSAELRQTVLQLQSEVAQMRQELAQVRAQLADVNANMGVGGAGQAGVAPPATAANRTAAPGAVSGGTARGTPLRAGTAEETAQRGGTAARDTDDAGEAVVNAIYTGTVRSVSDRRLMLLDENGQPFTVELGNRTRVVRDGQRISVQQLKQGTRVRATVDLLSGRNQATEIITLPGQ